MVRSRWLLAALLCAGLPPARAWTPVLEISAASSNERSTPRIVRSPANDLLTAYINKGSPWRVYARQRSAGGTWGPVEAVSGTSAGSTRPDAAFDGQGRPHILYASYLTGGALDLVHAYRSSEAWTVNVLTATSQYEDEPHVVTDSGGRIHMVFTRGDKESSAADVVYRRWNGSAWEGETVIGHTDHAYYRRPEICIDPANLLHVTWGDKVGSNYVVRYTRSDGSTWPGAVWSICAAP